jgi:hypothetical protein
LLPEEIDSTSLLANPFNLDKINSEPAAVKSFFIPETVRTVVLSLFFASTFP